MQGARPSGTSTNLGKTQPQVPTDSGRDVETLEKVQI